MQRSTCLLMLCIGCNQDAVMLYEPEVEVDYASLSYEQPTIIIEQHQTVLPPPAPESTILESPVPENEWTEEAKLWLARSLIGEVGWDRPEEQASVAWVYANRAKKLESYTFLKMVRRYSAAVRKSGQRRQPWVFELQLNNQKPKYWPGYVKWKGQHDKSWQATLDLINRWQAGKVPNYCPSANHFGSYHDSFRAEALRWTRVECIVPDGGKRFRNRFYDSTRLRPRRKRHRRS